MILHIKPHTELSATKLKVGIVTVALLMILRQMSHQMKRVGAFTAALHRLDICKGVHAKTHLNVKGHHVHLQQSEDLMELFLQEYAIAHILVNVMVVG